MQVDILVHAFADIAGQAQLDGVLGNLGQGSLVVVRLPGGSDVVSEPGMLIHVGDGDGVEWAPLDKIAIAGKQPGLVHEQALIGKIVEEAIAARREHGSPLAHIDRSWSHLQTDQPVIGRWAHRLFAPHIQT